MTDEQFEKARTLRNAISTAKNALDVLERTRVDVDYCLCGKGWVSSVDIPIEANVSVLEDITDAWTKRLEDAQKEYEEL